jgi:putative Mg2+ transporter-C (MgtC) family protein
MVAAEVRLTTMDGARHGPNASSAAILAAMSPDGALLARIAVGFAVSYVIGFERELRGSSAGDRTFALVGTAATAVTAVTARTSPQAIAGVVTGIGFIGAGVIIRGEGAFIRGVTTAATIFATTALGVVVGTGHLLVGVALGALMLLTLELRYIPVLNLLDARRYQDRVRDDSTAPRGRDRPDAKR